MDPDICPSWWPNLLWHLHFGPHPPGVGPINYPPAIEDIMAGLTIHTMSYMMRDQEQAGRIRGAAEASIVATVSNLSALHDEAVRLNEGANGRARLGTREAAGQIG